MALLETDLANYKRYWIHILSTLIALAVVIIVSDFLYHWKRRRYVKGIPLIHDGTWLSPHLQWGRTDFDWEKELQQAYRKYTKNGKPFAHTDPLGVGTIIVLPPQCSKEYQSLPRDHVSFGKLLLDEFSLDGIHDPTWKVGLDAVNAATRRSSLEFLVGVAATELDRILPHCISGRITNNGWHTSSTKATMSQIASELGHSLSLPAKLKTNAALAQQLKIYLKGIELQGFARRSYPWILRPLMWHLLPICRALRSSIAATKNIIAPEIADRLHEFENQGTGAKRDSALLLDILVEQAARDRKKGNAAHRKEYVQWIANEFLWLHFELIGPSPELLSFMVFHIMSQPKYVNPLREELAAALQHCQGKWSLDMFDHTPILESFTTETLRFYGVSYETGNRRVLKPLYIPSLGITLEAGSYISMPANLIHRDPEFYHNPDSFDGYRFYNPISGHHNSRRSIATTTEYMPFGVGSQICPGRLLGVRLSQLIFAKILQNYDLRKLEGETPFHEYFFKGMFPNPEIEMSAKARNMGK